MALSQPQLKKRSLVVAILAIAAVCNVHVDVQRESPDADVIRAFRKVMLKAHPDKGGSTADAQRLQGARAAWEDACSRAPKGRPKTGQRQQAVLQKFREAWLPHVSSFQDRCPVPTCTVVARAALAPGEK